MPLTPLTRRADDGTRVGGYHQFFLNPSREYVGIVVEALEAIGCPLTARITHKAIESLGLGLDLDPQSVLHALERGAEDAKLWSQLSACDRRYFEGAEEPIADRLLVWIGRNRKHIQF